MSIIKYIFILAFFLMPNLVQSQYHYPQIDACKMVKDLIGDINDGNIDFKTLEKYFNPQHEIEVSLEFEWCEKHNISEDNCQTELSKYIGDTSLTLKKIYTEFLPPDLVQLDQCKIIEDQFRTSDYIVDINNKSYIVRFDKKFEAIIDIVRKNGKSFFNNSDNSQEYNKKLVNRYFNNSEN